MKKVIYVLGSIVLAVIAMNIIGWIMGWLFKAIMIAVFAAGIYFWARWFFGKKK